MKRLVVVASLFALLAASCSGGGDVSINEASPKTTESIFPSSALELRGIFDQLSSGSAILLLGYFETLPDPGAVGFDGPGRVTVGLTLVVREELRSAGPAEPADRYEVEVSTFAERYEWLAETGGETEVVALVDRTGRLIDYSTTTADRARVGQSDLSRLMTYLARTPVRDERSVSCDPRDDPTTSPSGTYEALLAHLDGEGRRRAAGAAATALEMQVERIVAETRFLDPVTGLETPPDDLALLRAGRSGVSAEALTATPTVPVLVDVSAYEGRPARMFFLASDGRLLGEAPLGRGSAYVAMIGAPPDGSDVTVEAYVGDVWACPEGLVIGDETQKVLALQLDSSFFGSERRAHVTVTAEDEAAVRDYQASDLG